MDFKFFGVLKNFFYLIGPKEISSNVQVITLCYPYLKTDYASDLWLFMATSNRDDCSIGLSS